MSPEQWNYIQGSINSIRILMFALAKTSPNPTMLREAFALEKEILETSSLNSHLSESLLDVQRKKISEMEKAIWG
jgi:hypothetical protein